MLMEKKAAEKSLLAGRGSIAWENPVLSSTQKVMIEKIIRGLMSSGVLQQLKICTESIIELVYIPDTEYIINRWKGSESYQI